MKLGTSADGSDDYRNVANTYGWVVEIDPFNPHSTPKKRTALGRFAHEGAWLGPVKAGEPLVWYMGDDSRNEYIYKYVSNKSGIRATRQGGLAAGDKYLDDGRALRRAVPAGRLRPVDRAEVRHQRHHAEQRRLCVRRPGGRADQRAARGRRRRRDQDGSSRMGRRQSEEWRGLLHAHQQRRRAASDRRCRCRESALLQRQATTGTDQKGNPNGHIIRFAEDGGFADALSFTWDVFLFGARASADAANVNISGLSDANDFSSPDGCGSAAPIPACCGSRRTTAPTPM